LGTSNMQRAWQIWLLPALFFIFDYAAIVLAEHTAIVLRNVLDTWANAVYTIPPVYQLFWIPAFFMLFLKVNHTYQSQQPIVEIVRKIFYSVSAGC